MVLLERIFLLLEICTDDFYSGLFIDDVLIIHARTPLRSCSNTAIEAVQNGTKEAIKKKTKAYEARERK